MKSSFVDIVDVFFFFNQKTAYELRISDWSSDVCSSDLKLVEAVLDGTLAELHARVVADANQRKGEFVLLVHGAGEDADARIAEGQRVYAKLAEHLPPSTAAKLAAEITGAPRKALYGS